MNKDTLCDSLIFIAETLSASANNPTEDNQVNDDSTSNTQQHSQNSEGDFNEEDSSLVEEQQNSTWNNN